MTFQFKFSKTTETQLNIDASAIERARLEISDAGFDLLEICHKDEIHLHEIWKNSKTSEVISFNIIQEDLTDEVDECEDASRQDVVSELVDLWLELRAIRNHFTEVSDEEYFYETPKPLKPLEQFWQKVNEVKEERDADPEAWDFLFKGCIDETIYAYHELSYADRAAITH